MTTTVDTLIDRYLKDLEAELGELPTNRRREILDEVGEHITAAARERFGIPAAPAKPATPWLEVIALIALVIPFLGWVVRVVLVWVSRLWTTRDKLIGTVGGLSWVVAGLGTIAISARGSTAVGSGTLGPAETSLLAVVLLVVPFLLPIAAAIYLGFRLHIRRSNASATASATSPTTACGCGCGLRRHLADSPHRETAKPLPTGCGGESYCRQFRVGSNKTKSNRWQQSALPVTPRHKRHGLT